MNNPNRCARVFANGQLAGTLDEFVQGNKVEYVFTYSAPYQKSGVPIGHHFPVRPEPFVFDSFPPFFQNLVSEGWVRMYQANRARLDKEDDFGLLLANGAELIGALSVLPAE